MNEFTLAEVKDNNYIIVDKNVYNLLEFEVNHPGGDKVLKYFRGKDGTEKFNKITEHQDEKILEELTKYHVGILVENSD
jgi:cytochrome b involved in lipid metabolism|tara:strand:- start:125 stop:361 length:237 start_codon:yes stop_codon:yes gene_type:complete